MKLKFPNFNGKNYRKTITKKKAESKQIMSSKQFHKVSAIIHTAATASALAGAFPIPMADAIPITAAQVTMVLSLGRVFSRKITESTAKAMISSAAATFVGRAIVKWIPFVGWGISAAVAAGITEAVGWTIAVEFAKSAKSVWEHEYSDEEENIHQVPETPIAETDIDALRSAAEEFLSGKKTPTSEKDELEKLIKDIETVLDDLPDDHPLRDDFDRLAQLF